MNNCVNIWEPEIFFCERRAYVYGLRKREGDPGDELHQSSVV